LIERTFEKTGIPLGFETPEPKVDPWGRLIERGPGFHPTTDWLANFVLPTRFSDPGIFIGDRILMHWNVQNPSEEKFVAQPNPFITNVQGERVFFSDDQYQRYSELSGSIARLILQRQAPNLNATKPTERDLNAVRTAQDKGRSVARDMFLREFNTGERVNIQDVLNNLR